MICGRSPCYRLAQGLGHAHPTQRLIKFSLHMDSPLKFDPAYSILSATPSFRSRSLKQSNLRIPYKLYRALTVAVSKIS